MIKNRINKKKTSAYSKIRFAVFIAFIVVLIIIFYEADKSNTINKVIVNNIEKFSKNYGYSFSKVNINNLINIKYEEIEKYFTKYYGNSIFLIPIKEISKNLHQNKWIKDFTIKNDYKNTININTVESIPIGIYFNGEDNLLFDKNGEIIDFIYDPFIRSSLLIDVINEYIENDYKFPMKQQPIDAEGNYYIIHPVLKHIAILACD